MADALQFMTDGELIGLISTGDKAAFTEIYNRYWKKTLAIAYNHTKDKSAAEEIVQEIFIGLWNRRAKIDIRVPAHYLATAAKFAVFKTYYRAQKREQRLLNSLSFEESHEIEELISARLLQEYINGLVEQLPERCRLVFKYSREAGLSIPEIAGEMDIAEKTVEAHLTKALRTIRGKLNESGALVAVFTMMLYRR
jgi:RNA polymerase sigma-70 factor (family 1)